MPGISPRTIYVVLVGVARCSLVFLDHVRLSRTFVIF